MVLQQEEKAPVILESLYGDRMNLYWRQNAYHIELNNDDKLIIFQTDNQLRVFIERILERWSWEQMKPMWRYIKGEDLIYDIIGNEY